MTTLNVNGLRVNKEVGLNKALTTGVNQPWNLEEITPMMERKELHPGLLTALLVPSTVNKEFLTNDIFRFDEVTQSTTLPAGKSFSEYGPRAEKPRAKQFMYAVSSFGHSYNVAPQDYANRRKYGSAAEYMTEADVLAMVVPEAQKGWDDYMELALAQLLTTDTNRVDGGPFETYNFYTEIVGSARPAKIDMDLGNNTIDHFQNARKQRKLLEQELMRAGDSGRAIILCGDEYFDKRYDIEKQEGLARDLRSSFDFASMALPETSFGDGSWAYDNFTSHDGILYINYGGGILAGQKLIADADAYLIPVGSQKTCKVAYAPAQTRSYVNTVANEMYAWTFADERQGVTVYTESNYLTALTNPRAIRHLTTSS